MEIASRAGLLYDKFAGLAEDLEDVRKAILKSAEKLDDAQAKLSTGKGNIVKQLDDLKKIASNACDDCVEKIDEDDDFSHHVEKNDECAAVCCNWFSAHDIINKIEKILKVERGSSQLGAGVKRSMNDYENRQQGALYDTTRYINRLF
jgi:hypothetical protein